MKKSNILFYCFILFVASRLFFWALALSMHHLMHSPLPLSSLFTQLDSAWYVTIANLGYAASKPGYPHAYTVFFPLFPILIKAMALLTGLSTWIAGQVLSNLCFFAALCLFYHLMERDFGTETARIGCVLLAFSPYNIYFMAIYTESLFLLLTLTFWLAAKNRQWLIMGIAGSLMSATHPNGIVIGFFALWFIWDDYRKNHSSLWQYWPIFLIPLGLIAYMTFLYFSIGQPLAFVHYDLYWNRTGWHYGSIINRLALELSGEYYNTIIYVLSLCLAIFLWKRRWYKEALFMPIFTIQAILSANFVSLARYSGGLFAVYIGLALLAKEIQGRNWLIAAEIALSIPLMYWWLQGNILAF